MSDYDDIKKKITHEIQECHIVKEAQVPESAHAYRYQGRVTALTDMLHEFQRVLPRLRDLDRQIRVAEFDLDAASRAVQDGAAPYPKAAAWTGGMGAVWLFGSLGFGLPSFVLVGSVALALLSGLCVVAAVRRRRYDHDDLYRARELLGDLLDERYRLLPEDIDAAIENAGQERPVVPVRVVDDRPADDVPEDTTRPIEQSHGASTG